MIAFNSSLNDAMRKGLLFAGATWLLRAIEMKHPNCSVALAYSVSYQLNAHNGFIPLTEIGLYFN